MEILFYANEWKKNPKVDPYTKEEISISLSPDSKYVQLYIKMIDELVSNILKDKTKKVLSVEECFKIRSSLPDEHARVFLSTNGKRDKKDIYYDYLFIVYFVNSKHRQYDPALKRELNIYLDLAVYNTSKCVYNERDVFREEEFRDVKYLYIRKFLGNYLLNMSKSEFSIHSLVSNLCIDILNILYMKESTKKDVDNANFNMKVLEYCKAIFDNIPILYFKQHLKITPITPFIHMKELTQVIILPELMKNEKGITRKYKATYDTIMAQINDPETNIFETLLSIYNSILKLYKDRNKNTIYKNYIKYTSKKKDSELPPIPIRPQLSRELIMYKARSSNKELQELFDKEYSPNKKDQNEKALIVYETRLKEYEKQLKEYEKKLKDVKESDHSPTKSASGIEYTNLIDPYTQEAFSEMSPKKQMYTSNIVYNNGKQEYIYRFDTVGIYNYILKCIDLCDKPINSFNRVELTDLNLDEICNKIKHFTKTPTYTSSEIRALLDYDCIKYDNRLVLDYEIMMDNDQQDKDIKGIIHVYLNVKLGDIIFRVIQTKVLSLPYFNVRVLDRFTLTILDILNNKLTKGKLIGSRFFPYRRDNKIMNLPEFPFEFTDKKEDVLKILKRFKRFVSSM